MQSSITRIPQNCKPNSLNLLGSITQISEESRHIDQMSEYSQILHFVDLPRISACYTTFCPALWILGWLSFRDCRCAVSLSFSLLRFSCSYSLVSSSAPYHPPFFQLHFYHRPFFFHQPLFLLHLHVLWNYAVKSGFVNSSQCSKWILPVFKIVAGLTELL